MPSPEQRPFNCSGADGKFPLREQVQVTRITYSNGTTYIRCLELGPDNICRATIASSLDGKGIPCPWVGITRK